MHRMSAINIAFQTNKPLNAYAELAQTVEQFPKVGGDDLYYGGTSYNNLVGIGEQWPSFSEAKGRAKAFDIPDIDAMDAGDVVAVNVMAPYTPGTLLRQSEILAPRMAQPLVMVNSADADKWHFSEGDAISVLINGKARDAHVQINGDAPAGVVLLQGFGSRVNVDFEAVA